MVARRRSRSTDCSTAACCRGCPSAIAVAIGQWGLRHLPLDRLAVFRNDGSAPRDHARRRAPPQSADPLVDVLRHRDPPPRHGPGLRRGHGQEHHPGAAPRASAAESRAHPRPPRAPGSSTATASTIPASRPIAVRWRACRTACPSSWPRRANRPRTTCAVVEGLAPFGDLVEINISSPNTKLVYGWSERPARAADVFRAVRAATAQADHRQDVAGLPRDQRGDHDPGRARRGHHHRELRQHPPRGRAAPLAEAPAASRARPCSPTTLENVRRVRERFGDRLEIIATGGIDSARQGAPGARRGRDRVRVLHRLHHARPVACAPHPGRAAKPAEKKRIDAAAAPRSRLGPRARRPAP